MPTPSSFKPSPLILVGVVIILIGGLTLFGLNRTNTTQTTNVAIEASPTPSDIWTPTSPTPTISPTPTLAGTPTKSSATQFPALAPDGVTWLGTPVKIADLKLVLFGDGKNTNYTDPAVAHDYYCAGTYQGNELDLLEISYNDPSPYGGVVYFEKTATGYKALTNVAAGKILLNPDKPTVLADNTTLASNVSLDTTTFFTSISYVPSLTHASATLTTGNDIKTYLTEDPAYGYVNDLFDTYYTVVPTLASAKSVCDANATTRCKKDAAFYATTSAGNLYRARTLLDDASATEHFVLKRPDGTFQDYVTPRDSFMLDDSTLAVTSWKDGSANASTYRNDGGGSCGNPNDVNILPNNSLTDTEVIGTTKSGESLYGFTDAANNPIVAGWYKQTGGTYVDPSDYTKQIPITLADFIKKKAIVLYKDNVFDRVVVYRNTTYGPSAECGKPVVYLYPTKTEQVSVKVGATITASEPAYNDGWTVTAKPNGELTTADGKVWPNLFWEGIGNGLYPDVSTSGTVVAQADLTNTLTNQLTSLGLNTQERQDFLDFWLARLPKTPYVRLTWLGTKQMDRLAPLTVSPAPDTHIRIFLEFAGLQKPVPLTAQTLTAPARKGFTLVEWGGLLVRY